MRRRLLQILGTFCFRYSWVLMPLLAALTVLAARRLDELRYDTSLIGFLPARAEARYIREIVSDYRNLEPVMVVVRSREPGRERELTAIATELGQLLNNPTYVAPPVYRIDALAQSFYESLSDQRLVLLLTPEDWSALRELLSARISADRLRKLRAYRVSAFVPARMAIEPFQDPLGALSAIRERLARSRGPTRLPTRNGYFMDAEARTIALLLYPNFSPENGEQTTGLLTFLDRSSRYFFENHPEYRGQFDIEFVGTHVSAARAIRQIQHELGVIIKFSVPLALLLIIFVFRKVESVLFIVLPPAMGMIWTLALAQWAFGGISAMSTVFLIVIAGINVQYSAHLYHRFTIELYRHGNYYRALGYSYRETGRGVLASAMMVAIMFFALFGLALRGTGDWLDVVRILRDSTGFGQLGVLAGAGILLGVAACLVVLPMLAWVKHLRARGRVNPVELYGFGLRQLYEAALASPRAMLGVSLFACVFFALMAQGLAFDVRFASISPFFFRPEADVLDPDVTERQPSAVEGSGRAFVAEDMPRPGRPIIAVVRAGDLQTALEKNDRLYLNLLRLNEEYNVLSYDSLRTVLPSVKSQQASLRQLREWDLTPYRRSIERTSRAAGFKPLIYEPFIESLERFSAATDDVRYILFRADATDELIATVQRYVTSKDGAYYVATAIYPFAHGFRPSDLPELRERLVEGLDDLILIGDPIVERELSALIKFNLAVVVLVAIGVTLVALLLHFRSIRLTLMTFAVVLASLIWFGGALAMVDGRIHFFTVLALPLVLSLSMDNALQLTQYFRDRQPAGVGQTMQSVGRVVLLTCGLMALLYGTLALTSFRGLRDFGGALMMGSAAVFMASLMLLPALLQLYGREHSLLGPLALEARPTSPPHDYS